MRRGSTGVTVLTVWCALHLMVSSVAFAKPGDPGITTRATASLPTDSRGSDDTSTTARTLPEASHHTLDSWAGTDWVKFSVSTTGTPFVSETQIAEGDACIVEGTAWADGAGGGRARWRPRPERRRCDPGERSQRAGRPGRRSEVASVGSAGNRVCGPIMLANPASARAQ